MLILKLNLLIHCLRNPDVEQMVGVQERFIHPNYVPNDPQVNAFANNVCLMQVMFY